MSDASFLIHRPLGLEALGTIEAERMDLRREQDPTVAAAARFFDQRSQQRTPCSASAPRLEDRHAADVSVGQQACRADCLPIGEGERMDAADVMLIQLDLGRDALLVDEYFEADGLRVGLSGLPIEKADFEHRAKSIIWTKGTKARA